MWSTWLVRAYSIRPEKASTIAALDRLEAVLEEERRERRLEQRGEDVAVLGQPRQLVGRDGVRPAPAQQLVEAELARDLGAARARDDVRADLRHPPLGEVREAVVELPRDRELEDAVAEELEALVRGRPVGRPRRVREDVVEALLGQRLDQAPELRRGPGYWCDVT